MTRTDSEGRYTLVVPYSPMHSLSGVVGVCVSTGPGYISVDAYGERGRSRVSRLEMAKHFWLPSLDLVVE